MARRAKKAPVRRGRSPTFEERLGHRFRDRDRLEAAWVHRSAANERKLAGNYERLEFLGDAVLGMIAAAWLYRRHPDLPEGELSRRKSALVSAGALARYARELGLGAHLVLGQGEERSGGRDKSLAAGRFARGGDRRRLPRRRHARRDQGGRAVPARLERQPRRRRPPTPRASCRSASRPAVAARRCIASARRAVPTTTSGSPSRC